MKSNIGIQSESISWVWLCPPVILAPEDWKEGEFTSSIPGWAVVRLYLKIHE